MITISPLPAFRVAALTNSFNLVRLSLKDQGWLDKPSCPMLIVNGKNDLQTPIDDLYILLENGAPKAARVFPGGHMGQTPQTFPTIVHWLKEELS